MLPRIRVIRSRITGFDIERHLEKKNKHEAVSLHWKLCVVMVPTVSIVVQYENPRFSMASMIEVTIRMSLMVPIFLNDNLINLPLFWGKNNNKNMFTTFWKKSPITYENTAIYTVLTYIQLLVLYPVTCRVCLMYINKRKMYLKKCVYGVAVNS